MAEASTIARPYAHAVFEIAREDKRLAKWTEALSVLAAIASSDEMTGVYGNPTFSSDKVAEIFIGVAGDKLDDKGKNFVKVLADNNRLSVLPEIATGFELLRAEEEKTVKAELVSAKDVTDAQKKSLADALKKRLGRDVELSYRVDESLLGGAIIRAGDLVIDGSISGQLEKLATEMTR
ncbi:MAG: F0F1 ATP synthase subunit delta [Gammaproteobacteria bacterium]|nr:F0F1 ATP synthase subunit delta [Gammaproteobacteria bacterium]